MTPKEYIEKHYRADLVRFGNYIKRSYRIKSEELLLLLKPRKLQKGGTGWLWIRSIFDLK